LGQLSARDVQLGRVSVGSVEGKFSAAGGRCAAEVRAHSASVAAEGRCSFTGENLPELDRSAPVDVAFDAQGMDLELIEPLVEGVVEEVRGKLEGHLRARGRLDRGFSDLA